MECTTKDSKKDSLILYARFPSIHIVLSYDHTTNYTLNTEYKERVKVSGTLHKCTIKISDMQLKDSALYYGIYSKLNKQKNGEEKEEGCSILLFVNGEYAPVFRFYISDNIDAHSTLLY